MRSHLVRLQTKQITYRSYKNFNESLFLKDVQNLDFSCDSEDPNVIYESLVQKFQKIIEEHAPPKQKTVRGNQAPFMNKKQHIRKVTDSVIVENKKNWEVIKPFIANKNGLSNNNITLIQNNSVITDDK